MKKNCVFKSKRQLRRLVKSQVNKEILVIADKHETDLNSFEFVTENDFHCFSPVPFEVQDNSDGIHLPPRAEIYMRDINIPTPTFPDNFYQILLNSQSHIQGEQPNSNFIEDIKQWMIKFRHLLSQEAMNELLQIIRNAGFGHCPKDSRTLLRTPRHCDIISIDKGDYTHLGIENGLKNIFKHLKNQFITGDITLSLNIDGLPLTKSSGSQFWPILLSVDSDDSNISQPFIAGIYHGFQKPSNVKLFLEHFIDEMKFLQLNGFLVNNVNLVPKISKIICDAPAKSFLLCIKGHTGSSSCTKCIVDGDFINSRMSFKKLNETLRTDDSFKNKLDDDYHKADITSPLEELNIGLVSQVPLDYMHLVCLGVMKKLLKFWVHGKKNIRLAEEQILAASDHLLCIKNYIPVEFVRLPRSLKEVDRFKATEFRQLLLYTGPIVFKNILPKSKYMHFMAFHCAIRILCSPDLYLTHNNFANDLLKYFVEHFSKIYGDEFISHNVHNLIHLSSDCLIHGTLDTFSAFKYENYLYGLKKTVKLARYPLQQLINRLNEKENLHLGIDVLYPQLKNEIVNDVAVNEVITCYKTLILKQFQIVLNNKDNCVTLKNGKALLIKGIYETLHKQIFLFGNIFLKEEVLYDMPHNSLELFNMKIVSNLSDENYKFPLTEIDQKCIKYPVDFSTFIVIPLLHKEIVN